MEVKERCWNGAFSSIFIPFFFVCKISVFVVMEGMAFTVGGGGVCDDVWKWAEFKKIKKEEKEMQQRHTSGDTTDLI